MKKSRLFCLFVLMLTIISSFSIQAFADNKPNDNDISGEAAVLMEYETGDVVFAKNPHKKIYPASTTKIMTCLLAIENLKLDKVITVPDDFEEVEGSSMNLLPGEKFSVEQLLYCLMVKSSNDVAVLLGEEIGGDLNTFAKMMNDKATSIGCKETHFANPNGLHDPNHYTSAYDMALIAREAMKYKVFRKIVSTPYYTVKATPETKEDRIYQNTNRFLWSLSEIIYKNKRIPIKYSVVDGIKTGYTGEAGNCLVSSGYKNSIRFISAVFKSNGFDVFRDSRLLLDYGFDNFRKEVIVKKNSLIGEENFKRSVQKVLKYSTRESFVDVKPVGEKVDFKKTVKLDKALKLPIEKDQKVGELILYGNDEKHVLGLYADNTVESIFSFKHLKELVLSKNHNMVRVLLILVVVLLIITIIFYKYKAEKRRRRRKRLRRYRRY